MNDVVILIPPSEAKTLGGNLLAKKQFSPITQELLDELSCYEGDFSKLYGVKDKALTKAQEANACVTTAPTLHAIERYTGVVYQGFDYNSLSKEQKSYANTHVKIVSALFGLVGLDEPIPDYKLSMTKLQAEKRWKAVNTMQLKNFFVIDLLPKTHKKAVEYTNGIAVDFVVEKNGKKIPAGHQGKFIKGRFLRWLIKNKVSDSKAFLRFQEEGFRWNGEYFLKKH